MAAKIHPVAPVLDGLGNAADLAVGLEYQRNAIRTPQQFESRGQAGWARAGNYCNSAHQCLVSLPRSCQQAVPIA